MYISELYAAGFRCFGINAPLQLTLRPGLNVLVGPNDAGKTAIIDAPRHLLWTRGDDFVRLDVGDFHVACNGQRATELLIRCTFDDLTPDEESRFLEWCVIENGKQRLYLCLRGTLRKDRGGGEYVTTQYRAGKDADGLPLEGDLREYLKAAYLRPLRDAERELRAGRRSRLSKILGALPIMEVESRETQPTKPKTLLDIMKQAEAEVDKNTGVGEVQKSINVNYLGALSFEGDALDATLGLGAKQSFDQLLERLELYLNTSGLTQRLARGLGYNNILFMAAELLLLQSHPEQLPFLLIEEPEAHLHPQHQTLFMQVLEERVAAGTAGTRPVQVLLTTHSPQLAAGVDLETMTMVIGHACFPLAKGHTKLEEDDYSFLRRFLNSTKANLFFARGVIVVEGDAENLLIPALARKLKKPLSKHGVSIVNVGHRGLFRYSRILQRTVDPQMPLPVSLLPDRDIPPDVAGALVGPDRTTEGGVSKEQEVAHMSALTADAGANVAVFPSLQWTLEFDLALTIDGAIWLHQAVKLARAGGKEDRKQIMTKAKAEIDALIASGKSGQEIAVEVYTPLHKNRVSKAQVAEQLARILDDLPDDKAFATKIPAYLVAAINHARSGAPSVQTNPTGSTPLST